MIPTNSKRLQIKVQDLQSIENSFLLARVKNLLKKMRFQWTKKLLSFESGSEKTEERGFH